ncbi:glycogen/starch/alpha-glucan phosphorylase [Thiohalocapsa marina]|uniref:Alpha-1,4 glucan phosphorylase n=1 Tax=Thiohalocapsa marina TaxID=424902 RepID=A0A5M8FU57_9GAMM|nr:glycogen/starch/alpha-glucan phosphorylase [Thiohalocapsa marina]KAA6187337.1 glycogen/starch/alpha-glucan phosphorylase [Thiohalocapsa marina]
MSPFKDLSESSPNASLFTLAPLPMDADGIAQGFQHYYAHTFGRDRDCRSSYYPYKALAITLRDRLMERWKRTRHAHDQANCRRTYYLSLEFLMGRSLSNALLNLDLTDATRQSLYQMGLLYEEIEQAEMDAGLGNGGLGRLAACFLDSCATLQLPVKGYGLRYEYGMFRQLIEDGRQVEEPDHWMRDGNPWELERPEYTQRIPFFGRTEEYKDHNGRSCRRWVDTHDVLAVPYDIPIPGYRNDTINTLRLWSAAATDEFDLGEFNAGSYPESVAAKNDAEHITMVLYPNDANECGKELRLRQQFFLASASIKDVIREWVRLQGRDFSTFADKNCFQLNDTHPAVSVAELMRQLMDDHGLEWEAAWEITSRTMAYTNHTLLPEALERWPVRLFQQLLPRILEIIYEINARFLSLVAARWPGDIDRQRRLSLIEEGDDPQVRMAFLAIVGSFSVNGVAALHSDLLKKGLFRDWYELWPEKFNNKTNGVTPRRWLAMCNEPLRDLLDETIGTGWVCDLSQLSRLAPHADDAAFRARWDDIKQANKARLSRLVASTCGIEFPPEFMFDVQVKRIHEYKRQLLNILHVIHLYNRIKHGDGDLGAPRCVLIGGKAAPGYEMAKLIIKLINNVAKVVNADRSVSERLRVAFIPDYRVSVMEILAPGTDLSEQISTAGKEASGTGNMKFMMNGAVTIGTLDGANIEIRERVGEDNFFLFGLTAEEVERTRGNYDPNGIIAHEPALQEVMGLLESGHFNQFEKGIFDPIINGIRSPHDPWLTAADFDSYRRTQLLAAETYKDRERWLRMSILNTAHSGFFSSDRTIAEYNRDIWKLDTVEPSPFGSW